MKIGTKMYFKITNK